MKDYRNLFIELSLQQCTKDDYTDKLKIKKHNAACKKLKILQEEMRQHIHEDVFLSLLDHEDDRVKINAAAFCLQLGILVEKSILTLKKLIDTPDDSTICFSAKMLLQKHE